MKFRLEELNKTCGDEMDAEFLEKLLESDQEFDADEWDAKMGNAFNDTYYKVLLTSFLSRFFRK